MHAYPFIFFVPPFLFSPPLLFLRQSATRPGSEEKPAPARDFLRRGSREKVAEGFRFSDDCACVCVFLFFVFFLIGRHHVHLTGPPTVTDPARG